MLADEKQRLAALNINQSFIVQAPAGSGKTELLTQRYLNLLSCVNQPEEIIAITFTRKASHEMRERIIQALLDASCDKPIDSPHKLTTWQLANSAMKQNKRLNWKLLQHPGRLRIQTIDSLCHSLTTRSPTLSQNNPYATIDEDCEEIYQQAAKECLNYALKSTDYHQAASHLLHHLDNRLDRTLHLLAKLLARRDQWLSFILNARQSNRENLDDCIENIQQQALWQLHSSLAADCHTDLIDIITYAASNVEINNPINSLSQLSHLDDLTLETAKALSQFLLTQSQTLRKKFTKQQGILAPSSIKNKEHKQLALDKKEQLNQLMESLTNQQDFIEALILIQIIPTSSYSDEQWLIIEALLQLLPLAVAQLSLVFSENNKIDFSAISQQASIALGDSENPTDLTLYLDYQIKHLLIDEFQDTSIGQFELIEKITCGWQENEGKSLFIVGDPMQSIYRFRQAEVALFLKAKEEGIGDISLVSLELCANFRSTNNIITWINEQFSTIFPQNNIAAHGAISYNPSFATNDYSDSSSIDIYLTENEQTQADQIIKLITDYHQKKPSGSIGILVKNRRQLKKIIPTLKKAELSFQGVDIDNLSQDNTIQDLWTLTKALLNPSDKIAWLALLRSPLCGICLHDIHLISQLNPKQTLIQTLSKINQCQTLKDKPRLEFCVEVLQFALLNRQQQDLTVWVESIWRRLGGNNLITMDDEQNIERYFNLLDNYQRHGRLSNTSHFENKLNNLFSKNTTPALIQIMTIHKSKGLEFDCVILPCINANSSQKDSPLIQWAEFTHYESKSFLLSSIKAHDKDSDNIYDYLSFLDKTKSHYELQRLFYVAATRAKQNLFLLTDSLEPSKKNNFHSMLTKSDSTMIDNSGDDNSNEQYPIITKRPSHFDKKEFYSTLSLSSDFKELNTTQFQTSFGCQAKLQGVFTHSILQHLADNPSLINAPPPVETWRARLKELGANNIDEIIVSSQQFIKSLSNNPQLLSVLQKNQQSHTELSLTKQEDGQINTYIIDRCYVTDNVRWIVDYKSGKPSKNHEGYIKQLNNYASLFNQLDSLPIKCMIYYLKDNQHFIWNATYVSSL